MKQEETVRNFIVNSLKQKLEVFCKNESIILDDAKIHLEYSRNEKFGDYSTAFFLEHSKQINQKPIELAKKFIEQAYLSTDLFDMSVSEPAFVNFKIKDSLYFKILEEFFLKDDFIPQVSKKEKINIEYVSANPTGPLNVVSARSAANGNAIANLLKAVGHSVDTEYYVNDHGNQVFLLGVSVLVKIREVLGEKTSIEGENDSFDIQTMLQNNILPKDAYKGEYIKSIAAKVYLKNREEIGRYLERKDYYNLAHFLSKIVVIKILESQKEVLESYSIYFDKYFFESSLHPDEVIQTAEFLKKKEKVYQKENKLFFKSTLDGDDKDRVVIRESGEPTYFLSDAAYHRNKIKRNYDRMIDILGPDHHGYIARIRAAFKTFASQNQKLDILTIQQVSLIEKGQKQKMSKREGNFKTMEELIEGLGENAKDVSKYFFLMSSYQLPLDFDMELALDNSDKNPVFYLKYAHARICSIFKENGSECSIESLKKLEMTETRKRLLFAIVRFSDDLLEATLNLEPYKVSVYLQNLCKAFSKFYSDPLNKVKDADDVTKLGLNAILLATQKALAKGLSLLGITAPSELYKDEL